MITLTEKNVNKLKGEFFYEKNKLQNDKIEKVRGRPL